MKSTQLVTLISRDEKINASALWGPLRLGGPGPGPLGPLDKTALFRGMGCSEVTAIQRYEVRRLSTALYKFTFTLLTYSTQQLDCSFTSAMCGCDVLLNINESLQVQTRLNGIKLMSSCKS